jgi:hypothetical protein
MSAHRYQATWRSIIFNRHFDDSGLVDDPAHLVAAYVGSDYYLETLDPTGVQAIDYRELRQLAEGAEANQAFEGVRTWIGRGRIIASSPADLEDKTWAMYEQFSPAACRIASSSLTPPNVLPFNFKRASAGGAVALRFYGRPTIGRPLLVGRVREGLIRPFAFGLVAMDSRVYAQTETSSALDNLAGGNNTLTNVGNLYTHPTIEVVLAAAGGSTVMVTNVTTGQTFTLGLSAETAGTFLIDCQRATIYKGTTAKYSCRKAGFLTPFVLVPGANVITWSVDTGTTSVTFKWRSAYA